MNPLEFSLLLNHFWSVDYNMIIFYQLISTYKWKYTTFVFLGSVWDTSLNMIFFVVSSI